MNDFLPFRADWKGALGFVIAVAVAVAIAKRIPQVNKLV
jgi:hypothetical protein